MNLANEHLVMRQSSQHGMTLIELLVTLAVVAVFATLAAPGMQSLMASQQVSAAASELQASTLQTRNTALARNQQTVMQPLDGTNSTNGDFKNGWRIYVDVNGNQSYDAGTDVLIFSHDALPDSITVTPPTGKANQMTYSGLGFLVSTWSTGNATWTISATSTTRTKSLTISTSGRVRVT
jgi:prepilin-type N-terminal cleavage/methylation domain-containing protein